MIPSISSLDEKWYPGVSTNWDDAMFRARILDAISEDCSVLDLGAGAGIVPHMNFRGLAKRVSGIDLDPRVTENPYLDDAQIGSGEAIPCPDNTFDVVFSDNVLEHLEYPEAVFKEVARVLKPGGRFLFKTPNAWHYMPLIARLTPHAFHRYINRLRGRESDDTFPTRYRANTPTKIAFLADKAGFAVGNVDLIESRPEYVRLSRLTYFIGYLYERLVNNVSLLKRFRIVMIGDLIRQ